MPILVDGSLLLGDNGTWLISHLVAGVEWSDPRSRLAKPTWAKRLDLIRCVVGCYLIKILTDLGPINSGKMETASQRGVKWVTLRLRRG